MGMRTQAERLFQIYRSSLLNGPEADEAFMRPLQPLMSDMFFSNSLVSKAITLSRGHPFLLQLLGSELVDAVSGGGGELPADQFPAPGAIERLESEILNPAWRLTDDSQKRVLSVIAQHYATTQRPIGAQEVGTLMPRGTGGDRARVNEILQQLVALGLVFQPQPDQFALMIPLSEKMILGRSAELADAGEEKQLWYRGARVR